MDAVASESPPALLNQDRHDGRTQAGRGRSGRGRGRGRGRPPRRRNRGPRGDVSDGQTSTNSSESSSHERVGDRRHRGGRAHQSKKGTSDKVSIPMLSTLTCAETELSERLADQMNRGVVECVVCLDRIRRDRPIWSCQVCYVITHLHCARKWGSKAEPGAEGGNQGSMKLKCPSCRAPSGDNPKSLPYRCYCRRRRNPQFEPGILPGSCGDPCHRPRGALGSNCPHKCQALCHPGPCAPCLLHAPPMRCHCGKAEIFRRCGEEIPVAGVSCGEICGKRHWGCGHSCEKACHATGDEGECNVVLDMKCYCGKNDAILPCAVAGHGFACGERCGKKLECGEHECERSCHEGDCGPCSTSPEMVKNCPCGKTVLSASQRMARKSCLDPVPSCGNKCGKVMACLGEHECQEVCGHEGDCGPCSETILLECRCAATVVRVVCGENLDELRPKLICDRKCNERLLCKRHNCQTVCCMFKKRKAVPRSNVISSELIWSETSDFNLPRGMSNAERRRRGHQCSESCEKELSCGLHKCDLSCGHTGDCPPCGLLLREPLFCACGSESIPPPVRCGTSPPRCRKPCSKTRPCGHVCQSECHPGECDPCVELLEFACVGGHNERRFVPCNIGRKGIKCFRTCGKPLLCGIHACREPCHGGYPRECEPSKIEGCSQVCGLARKKCSHSCVSMCHPGLLCPDTPCQEVIIVSCPCGRRKERAKCLRGGMGGAQEKDDAIRLQCDDECTAQSRLRAFAVAVGKDGHTADASTAEGEINVKYSEFLLQFAEREPKALNYFEQELGHIVQGKTKKFTLDNAPQLHRLVLHTLADFYCLESESVGRAPNRHIVVRHRGAGVKPIVPRPLLSEALATREKERKRSRQLESGRTLIIHVASTTKHSATAQIEQRVEQELRSHVGSFRIQGRAKMASNLIGVSVEFGTPERAVLVKTSLETRPGVTIESPSLSPIDEGSSSRQTIPAAMYTQSWNDGDEYPSHPVIPTPLPAPAPVVVDDNVPDSWDD